MLKVQVESSAPVPVSICSSIGKSIVFVIQRKVASSILAKYDTLSLFWGCGFFLKCSAFPAALGKDNIISK